MWYKVVVSFKFVDETIIFLRSLRTCSLSFLAYPGLYVPPGTPPTQSVPMPVITQQPDVILRQEIAVAPCKNKLIIYLIYLLFEKTCAWRSKTDTEKLI